MAKASYELINALRNTASKLEKGALYQWGHMGACNCGNLVQEISNLSKDEIHEYAMRKKGDWTEQVNDYCPQSGMHMDLLIQVLVDAGLDLDDLRHLEKLSDKRVLRALPNGFGYLAYNNRDNVVLYLKTWAKLLEDEMQLILSKTVKDYNNILQRQMIFVKN